MSCDEARSEAVLDWWRRGLTALDDARTAAAAGRLENAVGRAYYAAFYAAKALLATQAIDVKKHSGVVSLLGRHFVRVGLLPPEMGRALHELMRARIRADYDRKVRFAPDEVAAYVEEAQVFLSHSQCLLQDDGWLNATGDEDQKEQRE